MSNNTSFQIFSTTPKIARSWSDNETMLSFDKRLTMTIVGNLMIEKIWWKKQWQEGRYASMHLGLNFLPAQMDSFWTTDSTFEYVLNLSRVCKKICLQTCTQTPNGSEIHNHIISVKWFTTLIYYKWAYGSTLTLLCPYRLLVDFRKIGVDLSMSDVGMTWLMLQTPVKCIQHLSWMYKKVF